MRTARGRCIVRLGTWLRVVNAVSAQAVSDTGKTREEKKLILSNLSYLICAPQHMHIMPKPSRDPAEGAE